MDSKTMCQHCSQHISFDAGIAGNVVACPNCNQLTKLAAVRITSSGFHTQVTPTLRSNRAQSWLRFWRWVSTWSSGDWGLFFFAIFIVICSAFLFVEELQSKKRDALEELRLKKLGVRPISPAPPVPVVSEVVYNSSWDGSVKQVKRWLQDNANDPSSIEFMSWGSVHKEPGGYWVQCKFRAKNSFGALVIQAMEFHLDNAGNVLKTLNL